MENLLLLAKYSEYIHVLSLLLIKEKEITIFSLISEYGIPNRYLQYKISSLNFNSLDFFLLINFQNRFQTHTRLNIIF